MANTNSRNYASHPPSLLDPALLGPAQYRRAQNRASTQGLAGSYRNPAITSGSRVPQNAWRNTNRPGFSRFAQRAKGTRSQFPTEWQPTQKSLGYQLQQIMRTEHHLAIAQKHFETNSLPRGIISPTQTFSTSFRPNGVSPIFREELHVHSYQAAQANFKSMQRHCEIVRQSHLLSAAAWHHHLKDSDVRPVFEFLEPKFLQQYKPGPTADLWRVVKGLTYGNPTSPDRVPVTPPGNKFFLQDRVLSLSCNSVVPMSVGALRDPGWPHTLANQVDQSSSGPSTLSLSEGNAAESNRLHRMPAHNQAPGPRTSVTDINGGSSLHTSEESKVSQSGAASGVSPSLPSVSSQETSSRSGNEPDGPLDSLLSGPDDGGPDFARTYHPGQANGGSINITPAGFKIPPSNTIASIITTQGVTSNGHLINRRELQHRSYKLRRHLDQGPGGLQEFPDLINRFHTLPETSAFFSQFEDTLFWSTPRDTYPDHTPQLNNGVYLVKGRADPGSNFFSAPILFQGIYYATREHCYQFQKLMSHGIPFHKIEKYFKDPTSSFKHLPADFDPMDPGNAKTLATKILQKEKRSNKAWEQTRLIIMADILIAATLQNRELFNLLMNPNITFFHHPVNDKDNFWGGSGNYFGKLLNFTREVLVSTTSHAVHSGSYDWLGPLTNYLPANIYRLICQHPFKGIQSYDIPNLSTTKINKITKQPSSSDLLDQYKKPASAPGNTDEPSPGSSKHSAETPSTGIPPTPNDPETDPTDTLPTSPDTSDEISTLPPTQVLSALCNNQPLPTTNHWAILEETDESRNDTPEFEEDPNDLELPASNSTPITTSYTKRKRQKSPKTNKEVEDWLDYIEASGSPPTKRQATSDEQTTNSTPTTAPNKPSTPMKSANSSTAILTKTPSQSPRKQASRTTTISMEVDLPLESTQPATSKAGPSNHKASVKFTRKKFTTVSEDTAIIPDTATKLLLTDYSLQDIGPLEDNFEVQFIKDLNPAKLKHLLDIKTKGNQRAENLTHIYLNIGYSEVEKIKLPTQLARFKSEPIITDFKKSITLLKTLAPKATIHIFELRADKTWCEAGAITKFNRAIQSLTTEGAVPIAVPQKWCMTSNPKKEAAPTDLRSVRIHLLARMNTSQPSKTTPLVRLQRCDSPKTKQSKN